MNKIGVFSNGNETLNIGNSDIIYKINTFEYDFSYLEKYYKDDVEDIKTDISNNHFYITSYVPDDINLVNPSQDNKYLITYDISNQTIEGSAFYNYKLVFKKVLHLYNNKFIDIIENASISRDFSSNVIIENYIYFETGTNYSEALIYYTTYNVYIYFFSKNITATIKLVDSLTTILDIGYSVINNKEFLRLSIDNNKYYIKFPDYSDTITADVSLNETTDLNSVLNYDTPSYFKTTDFIVGYSTENYMTIDPDFVISYNTIPSTTVTITPGGEDNNQTEYYNNIFNKISNNILSNYKLKNVSYVDENKEALILVFSNDINTVIYSIHTYEQVTPTNINDIKSIFYNLTFANVLNGVGITNNNNIYTLYKELVYKKTKTTYYDTTTTSISFDFNPKINFDLLKIINKDDKLTINLANKYIPYITDLKNRFTDLSGLSLSFNEKEMFELYNTSYINKFFENGDYTLSKIYNINISLINKPLFLNISLFERCGLYIKPNTNFHINKSLLLTFYRSGTLNIKKYNISNKETILSEPIPEVILDIKNANKKDLNSTNSIEKRLSIEYDFEKSINNFNGTTTKIMYSFTRDIVLHVYNTIFEINSFNDSEKTNVNIDGLSKSEIRLMESYSINVFTNNIFTSMDLGDFINTEPINTWGTIREPTNGNYKINPSDITNIKLIDNRNETDIIDQLQFDLTKLKLIDYNELKPNYYSESIKYFEKANFTDLDVEDLSFNFTVQSNIINSAMIDGSSNLLLFQQGVDSFEFNSTTNKITSTYYISIEDPYIDISSYQGSIDNTKTNPADEFNEGLNLNDMDFNNDLNFMEAGNDVFNFGFGGENTFAELFVEEQTNNEIIYNDVPSSLITCDLSMIPITHDYTDLSYTIFNDCLGYIINYYGKYRKKLFIKLEISIDISNIELDEFNKRTAFEIIFNQIIPTGYSKDKLRIEIFNEDFCLLNKFNIFIPEFGFSIKTDGNTITKTFKDSDTVTGYPGMGSISYSIDNREETYVNITRSFNFKNIFKNEELTKTTTVDTDNTFANFKLNSLLFNEIYLKSDDYVSFFSQLKTSIENIQRKRIAFLNSYLDIILKDGSGLINIYDISFNSSGEIIDSTNIPTSNINIIYKFKRFIETNIRNIGLAYNPNGTTNIIGASILNLRSKNILAASLSKSDEDYLEVIKSNLWVQFIKEEFSLFDFMLSEDVFKSQYSDITGPNSIETKLLYLMLFDAYILVNNENSPFTINNNGGNISFNIEGTDIKTENILAGNWSDTISVIPSYFIDIADVPNDTFNASGTLINLTNEATPINLEIKFLNHGTNQDLSNCYIRVLDIINIFGFENIISINDLLNKNSGVINNNYNERNFIIDTTDKPELAYYPSFINPKTTCFYLETFNEVGSENGSELVGLTLFSSVTMTETFIYRRIIVSGTVYYEEIEDYDGDGTFDILTEVEFQEIIKNAKVITININFTK